MAITPQAGYQVDPTNANGVIPIGSGPTGLQQVQNAGGIGIGTVNTSNAPSINTTQPNPATVTTQPNQTQPNQTQTNQSQPNQINANQAAAAKLGVAIPGQGGTITSDAEQTANKYKAALSTVSSTPVPTTSGAANSAISQATAGANQQQQQQEAQDTQKATIQGQLQADPGYQQLLADHTAYLNSENQQTTLEQDYSSLSDQLGLPALNTQLVNMQAVINGTEDDIRNEITKSGGFATESQVMALASARNKTLTQNYNNLLATRDNAQTQLSTMIGLDEKDKAAAQQQASDQLNFDQQVASYTQKFTQNAQDALTSMQKTEGWDGIYKAAIASGDPSAIQRINSTMGNGFDLATMAKQDAAVKAEQAQTLAQTNAQASANLAKTKADIANTQANTDKTRAEISDASGAPNPAKTNQPGYDATGVKYSVASAAQELTNEIKTQGLMGTRKLLAPSDFNQMKAWWVAQGLKNTDFDDEFGGYKDSSRTKEYN